MLLGKDVFFKIHVASLEFGSTIGGMVAQLSADNAFKDKRHGRRGWKEVGTTCRRIN